MGNNKIIVLLLVVLIILGGALFFLQLNSTVSGETINQTITYQTLQINKTIQFSENRVEEYSFTLKNPSVLFVIFPKSVVTNASQIVSEGDFSSSVIEIDPILMFTSKEFSPGEKKLKMTLPKGDTNKTSLLFVFPLSEYNTLTAEEKKQINDQVIEASQNGEENFTIAESKKIMQDYANEFKDLGLSSQVQNENKIYFASIKSFFSKFVVDKVLSKVVPIRRESLTFDDFTLSMVFSPLNKSRFPKGIVINLPDSQIFPYATPSYWAGEIIFDEKQKINPNTKLEISTSSSKIEAMAIRADDVNETYNPKYFLRVKVQAKDWQGSSKEVIVEEVTLKHDSVFSQEIKIPVYLIRNNSPTTQRVFLNFFESEDSLNDLINYYTTCTIGCDKTVEDFNYKNDSEYSLNLIRSPVEKIYGLFQNYGYAKVTNKFFNLETMEEDSTVLNLIYGNTLFSRLENAFIERSKIIGKEKNGQSDLEVTNEVKLIDPSKISFDQQSKDINFPNIEFVDKKTVENGAILAVVPNNGKNDLIVAYLGKLFRYFNDGNGNFTSVELVIETDQNEMALDQKVVMVTSYLSADLDHDGKLDAVITVVDRNTENSMVVLGLFNQGENKFIAKRIIEEEMAEIKIADITNDAYSDVLVRDNNKLIFMVNDHNKGFVKQEFKTDQTLQLTALKSAHFGIYFGEFTGDKKMDFIAHNDKNELLLWVNDGNNYFKHKQLNPSTSDETIYSTESEVLVDSFADGNKLDVAFVQSEDSALMVLLNDGKGKFTLKKNTSVQVKHLALSLDLDKKSGKDILFSQDSAFQKSILLNANNEGEFIYSILPCSDKFNESMYADIDGDGYIDLVQANGTVSLMKSKNYSLNNLQNPYYMFLPNASVTDGKVDFSKLTKTIVFNVSEAVFIRAYPGQESNIASVVIRDYNYGSEADQYGTITVSVENGVTVLTVIAPKKPDIYVVPSTKTRWEDVSITDTLMYFVSDYSSTRFDLKYTNEVKKADCEFGCLIHVDLVDNTKLGVVDTGLYRVMNDVLISSSTNNLLATKDGLLAKIYTDDKTKINRLVLSQGGSIKDRSSAGGANSITSMLVDGVIYIDPQINDYSEQRNEIILDKSNNHDAYELSTGGYIVSFLPGFAGVSYYFGDFSQTGISHIKTIRYQYDANKDSFISNDGVVTKENFIEPNGLDYLVFQKLEIDLKGLKDNQMVSVLQEISGEKYLTIYRKV